MNLSDTIYAHAQALPIDLQRETLDFIAYLEQRYHVIPKQQPHTTTEAFLACFAGCLGNDFPDEIGDSVHRLGFTSFKQNHDTIHPHIYTHKI